MQHSFEEHQSIVDAVINSDEDLAERLIKEHVSVQGEKFTDLVATMGPENTKD